MNIDPNIENLIKNHLNSAAYLVDESGIALLFNDAGKKYLPDIEVGSEFFKLFEEDASQFIERLFLESKNFNKLIREELSLDTVDLKDEYDVAVSPMELEETTSYLITIQKTQKRLHKTSIDRFKIYTSEIEEIIDDKAILDIIRKIKSSFPFTFIGKTKFQKDVDKLEDQFWIKEPSGKYIIVNQKYANSLGVKASQIEGQNEKDLLPRYLLKLYSTLDNYVIETTNAVFIDRVTSADQDEFGETTEIVEFPILDVDNHVVAIVGLSRKKKSGKKQSDSNIVTTGNIIANFSKPAIIIDEKNKVIAHSLKIYNYLLVPEKSKIIGKTLDEIIDENVFAKVTDYKKSLVNESVEFDLKLHSTLGDKEIHLIISRIADFNGDYIGTSIEMEEKIEQNQQIELKGKMYDLIMQASPEAMFVYDVENLKFLEVNDAALKLYGYKRNVFLSMDLTDLYAPEDIQTLIESSDNKKLAGTFTGPWRHKKSDGSSILVELSKTDLDYQGLKAHLNIVRDVTKELEENRKNQLFKAAYENSNEIIINTDKDGFITHVNEAAVKILERTKKDLEKRPFLSLVGDNDRAKINSEVFHSGEKSPQKISIELKKESGDLFDAEIITTPIIDYMGEIDSFSLIIRPEIEYSSATEIEPKQKTSQSTTGIIDAPFLSNVFHELLTPINVIIGFVQELQESIGKPTDEQQEAIQIINENQKLLLQLMDNAVEYSQLEQQQITLKPENILFTDIVEELREGVKKTAAVNNVEFAYGKISSSLKFDTDKHRVISLLTLFLKFAVQITKEKKVFLSAYLYDDENCVITVKDKRSGITTYLSKGLTEIFTKDENQIRRNYGFSRFTVKLTQKLVQLLAAETEIINKDGNPVEYGVIFPLKFKGQYPEKEEMETVVVKGEKIPIAEGEPVVETIEPQKQTSTAQSVQESINVNVNIAPPEKTVEKKEEPAIVEEPVKEETPPPPPVEEKPIITSPKKAIDIKMLSCLYVEDQVDSQILFKVQMKDLRSMEFALSFEEALPLIKSHIFDFIVLDINLQGEYNGLDALRIIQKLPGYGDTPIIAVTAYVLPGDREKFIAAGFTDFISKPVLRDKLMDVLKRIFG